MNQYENIPEELKQLPQWICHRNKVPFNPATGKAAKAGQPDTWARFEDAVKASGSFGGIGFEFNNNGIVGIDLDKVIADDGTVSDEADEIVAMLDSYTEYSPSGKGLHIFVKGDILVDGRKKGFIEMYKAKRYFTMTGNVYGDKKPINECTDQINSYLVNISPIPNRENLLVQTILVSVLQRTIFPSDLPRMLCSRLFGMVNTKVRSVPARVKQTLH